MGNLQFVLGRAGSGKSEYICEQAVHASQCGKNAILIVPEQYSHEREMQMLKENGYICESLNVTSFNRLASRIIADSGMLHRRTDASGKAMLLSRAFSRCRNKLTYFKKAEERSGYIDLFLDAISEFKKGQVTPEALKAASADATEPLFCARLFDIALIYEEYNKLLSDDMCDGDDDITLLSSLCFGNQYIKNSTIYIDEFFRFTKNEIFCIQSMMSAGADVVVSLCMPDKDYDDGIFSRVHNTKKTLESCAKEVGANILPPKTFDKICRFSSLELAHLEDSMATTTKEYSEVPHDISVAVFKNMYDEVTYVASRIKQLIKQGMQYRDIAVIAGDYEGYKDLISSTFSLYDIPVFIDTRKKFLDHPIVIYLFSVFDLLSGITTDKISVYMKSGFADILPEEASRLENFALAAAINYNDWLDDERFLKKSTGIFETEEESGEEGIHQAKIKNRLLAPVVSLKEKISQSKNVADRVNALIEFFKETNLEEKIAKKAEEFSQEGKFNLADEYTETYNIVKETLETLKSCLGNEDTGVTVLREILTAGFTQKSIGIIPKVYDSISFGDINRSVIKNHKALFMIGVNEGKFPALPVSCGILSDDEREYLLERNISVAPNSNKLIEDAEFSLYENVNGAREKLIVTYPIDSDGTGLRPAGFISKLKRIFKSICVDAYIKDDVLPPDISVASKASAYSYVLNNIKDIDKNPIASRLLEELSKDTEYSKKIERAIRFSQYENQAGRLSDNAVSMLYGKSLVGSVSKFERFSACPFSFFVEYGLRAKERKVLKIETPDIGSLLHEVVERFSNALREKNLKFKTVTKAQQKAICDEIIEEMFGTMMIKKVFTEGRIEALKTRLKSLVAKSVWAICEHISRGEFEPAAFELSFDKNGDIEPVTITLPTGEEITMIGRIDRIDTYSSEGKLYIKIIDYKSGNKSYSLSDIFNMTTLQLSVYAIAVTENSKEELGAGEKAFGGMFYFKLDDPLEESMPDGDMSDEKALKAFKMSGLLSDNPDVIHAMDNTNTQGWSSIIPVYMLKNGSASKSQSKLASPEQYEKLKKYVKSAVTKIGQEIISGNIDIKPVRDGAFTPCVYCKYRLVCGFDPNVHPCRFAKKFSSDDEIWNEME